MEKVFGMSDLGEMKCFLGMEVLQVQKGIFINQGSIALNILKRFCMEKCKPISTPVTLVEKLSSNDEFEKVNEENYRSLTVAKWMLRYIKGSTNLGVWFEKAEELKLVGYTNSDWARSVDDMKSTSGYLFSLGSGVFSWSSKKQ
ncbi:uncharacterized mitochondrial protein AtMg00810-like [Gossypium hirsutum]|uniref:Uncharacterized mitochondrial protein AtMg00810-like n=1 Tax=Gossypium hirsutum TaxID=3635 RepID=A0A1U8P8F0_GOSHI|nr:uncharacterized mitochondrial protein AtMg00810-like [Gossypium hirsutum]